MVVAAVVVRRTAASIPRKMIIFWILLRLLIISLLTTPGALKTLFRMIVSMRTLTFLSGRSRVEGVLVRYCIT